jgi:hypothetical protein
VPSGAIKHIHVRARSHRDDSGNVEFIGAVTDITHRKSAEEAEFVNDFETPTQII